MFICQYLSWSIKQQYIMFVERIVGVAKRNLSRSNRTLYSFRALLSEVRVKNRLLGRILEVASGEVYAVAELRCVFEEKEHYSFRFCRILVLLRYLY